MGDIRLAVMELGWNNPSGENIIPFLKEVKAAGYEGVSGFAHRSWSAYREAPAEFGSMLDGEGLKLASIDVESAVKLDDVRKICAFMAELECENLVCLGGLGTAVDSYEALGPVLENIGRVSLEYGVRTAYHNGRTRETITDMETVYANADPSLVYGLCDTGHATRDFVEVDHADRAEHFMRKHWDRLDFIEFKDWKEDTDLDTPVGEGLCGWEKVFDLIKEKKYKGWILCEQNGNAGLEKTRSPFECAQASREFVRSGLGV
jgi:sugar phosphate isomerase/epimerase